MFHTNKDMQQLLKLMIAVVCIILLVSKPAACINCRKYIFHPSCRGFSATKRGFYKNTEPSIRLESRNIVAGQGLLSDASHMLNMNAVALWLSMKDPGTFPGGDGLRQEDTQIRRLYLEDTVDDIPGDISNLAPVRSDMDNIKNFWSLLKTRGTRNRRQASRFH